MRNQSKRDKAMLELYKPFLQAGFTSDAIKNWSKYLRSQDKLCRQIDMIELQKLLY